MTVLQVEPSQPSNAVMLIDTDIQVEIAPSTAEEEALLQRERDKATERAAAREQVVYVYVYIHIRLRRRLQRERERARNIAQTGSSA